jgi:hypothetical protein
LTFHQLKIKPILRFTKFSFFPLDITISTEFSFFGRVLIRFYNALFLPKLSGRKKLFEAAKNGSGIKGFKWVIASGVKGLFCCCQAN